MPGNRALTRKPLSHSALRDLLIEALENAWDPSTRRVYKSHLKSYLLFVKSHNLDPEPNETTLALYVAFMSQHIKPSSVESYLTGITHYLLAYYPNILQWRSAPIVQQTLRGCKKLHGTPVKRKRALTLQEISSISSAYFSSTTHDDLLFLILLLTGFFGLLRLGELVYPEEPQFDNPRKMITRASLALVASSFSVQLPYHKADRFYQGNTVLINANSSASNPVRAMARYVSSRDRLFPHHPDLFIRESGDRPRRKWFLTRLRLFCSTDVAGHSLRSGGATMLAMHGVRLDIIQALGRWSSDTFRSYIRLHPALLHAAIAGST